MNKTTFTVASGVFLTACVEYETNSDSTSTSLDINYFQSIRGAWLFTDPGTQCNEVLVISVDSFSINSANEEISGNYKLNVNSNNINNTVAFSVNSDNGLTDCSGAAYDNTGEIIIKHIQITDTDTMRLYSDASTPENYVEYRRQNSV